VRRLACLAVPLFPLAARLRSEPELRELPVVLLEGQGNAARVVAATRLARQAGVRPGATLPQAKALLPELVTRPRDALVERAAQEALFEAALSFSPRVECRTAGGEKTLLADSDAPGVVTLDMHGLDRRFSERDLGVALILAAERRGLPVRVGVADTKLAARIAASLPETPAIVPPRRAAEFLSPLPLGLLMDAGEPLAVVLERWGLRTIGELAALAPAEVASRLGVAGYRLHEMARGVDKRPLVPREPAVSFQEGLDFEWTLGTLEAFLGYAREALERLTARLSAQGLGCARLELELRLDPYEGSGEAHDLRSLPLPSPTVDVDTLLTLVRLGLDARPPGAPVTGFALTAHPDRPRRAQLTLFGPPELSPDRLATALARLAALVGEERYGTPATVDAHAPERHAVTPYAPPPPPPLRRPVRDNQRLLAVRVLRPPVELEVVTDDREGFSGRRAFRVIPGGLRPPPPSEPELRPLSVRSLAPDGPSIGGPVRGAVGPWQLEEGWWGEPPARDYWDVELPAGTYRIFRVKEGQSSGNWYADGIYD